VARLTYVGRLLRWQPYARLIQAGRRLRFTRALFVEPPHPDHGVAIASFTDGDVRTLALRDPPPEPPPPLPADLPERFWLIVHSGPRDEVRELAEQPGRKRVDQELVGLERGQRLEQPGAVARDVEEVAAARKAVDRDAPDDARIVGERRRGDDRCVALEPQRVQQGARPHQVAEAAPHRVVDDGSADHAAAQYPWARSSAIRIWRSRAGMASISRSPNSAECTPAPLLATSRSLASRTDTRPPAAW